MQDVIRVILAGIFFIIGTVLLGHYLNTTDIYNHYPAYIVKVSAGIFLGLLIVVTWLLFNKKRHFNSIEKMSGKEFVLMLLVVLAIGGLSYAAEKYIYRPCGIGLSWDSNESIDIILFVFPGLTFLAYLLIRRVRWFSNHIGWLVTVAIATVLMITTFAVGYWCY